MKIDEVCNIMVAVALTTISVLNRPVTMIANEEDQKEPTAKVNR